jgi:hypothetical protein
MNLKFLIIFFSVMIILPFSVSAQGKMVVDELGILQENQISEIEDYIRRLEEPNNYLEISVSVRLFISGDNFDDEQSFRDMAWSTYSGYRLGPRAPGGSIGNSFYNTLIFYARVDGEPNLGYVYSSIMGCEPLNELIGKMKEGDLGQHLSGDELVEIVKKIVFGIEEIHFVYDFDCIIKTCEIRIRNGWECEKFDSSRPTDVYICTKGEHLPRQKGCYYAQGYEELRTDNQTTDEEGVEITEGKTVFLIDDTNWKDVLSLYPIGAYHYVSEEIDTLKMTEREEMKARKNKISYNPVLVYHRENGNVDLESTLTFIKHFKPDKVLLAYRDEVPKKVYLAMEKGIVSEKTKKKKRTGSETSDDSDEGYEFTYINAKNYYAMWNQRGYEYIVVSESDYKTGLLASVFASYLNAPLLFEDSEEFDKYNFNGKKKVYYIYSENKNSDTYSSLKKKVPVDKIVSYDIPTLQRKYAGYTNTDKVILVNPNDIDDKYCEQFTYKSKFGKMKNAYCKDSLVSPFLATIKNELIIFTDAEPLKQGVETGKDSGRFDIPCTKYEENPQRYPKKHNFESEIDTKTNIVIQDVRKQIQNTCCPYVKPKYFTIISSPKMIPSSYYFSCEIDDEEEYEERSKIDYTNSPEYGSGWIFGISVSDSSSYVNRDVGFYKAGLSYVPSQNDTGDMQMYGNILLMATDFPEEQSYMPYLADKLDNSGYDVSCFVDNETFITEICDYSKSVRGSIFAGNDIIFYNDHGSPSRWSGVEIESSEIPEIYSSIAIADACHTMNYYESEEDKLFGPNFIRNGGLGYYGSVGVTYVSGFGLELFEEIIKGSDLGNALESVSEKIGFTKIREHYMLLGDPTIKPSLIGEVLEYQKKQQLSDEKKYACTLVKGVKRCYRKGLFKMYCGEDEIVKGMEKVKCGALPSKKGRDTRYDPNTGEEYKGLGYKSLPHMLVFSGKEGTVKFRETEEDVSITCGDDFSYHGPALLTDDGGWLGEAECVMFDEHRGEALRDVKIAYMEGDKLKKETVT